VKIQIRLFLLLFFAVNLSCNKTSSPTLSQSKVQLSINEVVSAPVIVRLQKNEGTVLAELKLSFEGDERIESQLTSKQETVQNLVIQTVSDFSYSDLTSEAGKLRFQKQLLSSINQFVDKKSFEKINILEVKEI